MRLPRLLPYVPSLLLVCVALCQVGLAYTVDLSPWLGGGFGMFSTVDDGVNRSVRVFLVRKEGEEEAATLPAALADLEGRVRALPSPGQLSALATAIAAAYVDAEEHPDAVRIEVWRTRFEGNTLTPRRQRLREFVLTIDHE